jgi:hypothetical protein
MNFKKIGKGWKLATSDRPRLFKIGLALILSNIFFFLLIGGSHSETEEGAFVPGTVAMHIEARVLTPLFPGKRILIVSHKLEKKIEGHYLSSQEDGRVTVEVMEEDAEKLLRHSDWEILPPLKNLAFQIRKNGGGHEIHY